MEGRCVDVKCLPIMFKTLGVKCQHGKWSSGMRYPKESASWDCVVTKVNFGLFCSGFYVMGEEGVVCWQMMVAAFDLGGWKDEMKNGLGVLLKSRGNFSCYCFVWWVRSAGCCCKASLTRTGGTDRNHLKLQASFLCKDFGHLPLHNLQ